MSEAKFTEGPWEVGGLTPSRVYAYSEDGQRFLLAATGNVQPNSGENCHLIAAAPEMYGILDKVRLSKSMAHNEIEHSDLLSELHHDIEKVLAKARGEA